MPKAKPSTKKKTTKTKPTARQATPAKKSTVSAPPRAAYSEEYVEYLERHALYGTGRPRLSQSEFDRLDDEMLDLLGLESETGLNDDQIVRLQELEYLLLDSEQ